MGSSSLAHWLIVSVALLLLFGARRVPLVMGELAAGIKSFKAGLGAEPHPLPVKLAARDVEPDR